MCEAISLSPLIKVYANQAWIILFNQVTPDQIKSVVFKETDTFDFSQFLLSYFRDFFPIQLAAIWLKCSVTSLTLFKVYYFYSLSFIRRIIASDIVCENFPQ